MGHDQGMRSNEITMLRLFNVFIVEIFVERGKYTNHNKHEKAHVLTVSRQERSSFSCI